MSFDVVCFDCDSTLSKIEGIDELARRVGLGEELAKLTDAAMNGDVALESIYGKRLELIKPNRAEINELAKLYIAELVDSAAECVEQLQHRQKEIHIISGGLRPAILPLARKLNIPDENVHAVDVYFSENGDYLGYDTQSPLAKNGGKAEIVAGLLNSPNPLLQRGNCRKGVLIGDGKTDLEAQQAGAKVIGFGGVVQRELVKQHADFYVTHFSQILSLID